MSKEPGHLPTPDEIAFVEQWMDSIDRAARGELDGDELDRLEAAARTNEMLREALDDDPLEQGLVLVAPGDRHLFDLGFQPRSERVHLGLDPVIGRTGPITSGRGTTAVDRGHFRAGSGSGTGHAASESSKAFAPTVVLTPRPILRSGVPCH